VTPSKALVYCEEGQRRWGRTSWPYNVTHANSHTTLHITRRTFLKTSGSTKIVVMSNFHSLTMTPRRSSRLLQPPTEQEVSNSAKRKQADADDVEEKENAPGARRTSTRGSVGPSSKAPANIRRGTGDCAWRGGGRMRYIGELREN
jgi:hypothetical protein